MKKTFDFRNSTSQEIKKFFFDINQKSQAQTGDANTTKIVTNIISDIIERDDSAISDFAKKIDGLDLDKNNFKVEQSVIDTSDSKVPPSLKEAIKLAYKNIKDFSNYDKPKNWEKEFRSEAYLGEKFYPLEKVLCYIPSGTAPLISTVLHTAVLAQAAGVKEIHLTSCANHNNEINPAILWTAKLLDINNVYRLGGVYAIASFAYGTETIPIVDKIVGPGNNFVAEAKRQVFGQVDIDMIAGPSELMIIATDDNINPIGLASDLLSQAEHGSKKEKLYFVSPSLELIEKVQQEIENQKLSLPKIDAINTVLENNCYFIHISNTQQAIDCANFCAPEHLEVIGKNIEKCAAEKIHKAGAIFYGYYSPEVLGDYVAGPSHVLPTAGTARFSSGLTINDFIRRTSTIKYSKQALKKEYKAISNLANAEQLKAHSQAVLNRFK